MAIRAHGCLAQCLRGYVDRRQSARPLHARVFKRSRRQPPRQRSFDHIDGFTDLIGILEIVLPWTRGPILGRTELDDVLRRASLAAHTCCDLAMRRSMLAAHSPVQIQQVCS